MASWQSTPLAGLALVIVLDQFPRNMFRGTAKAFSTDALALAAARGLVTRRFDRILLKEQRCFAYLPFIHSEDLACQRRGWDLLSSLGPEYAEDGRRHFEIVARFGRFPHRNAALGRQSTEEEVAFLGEPGSSF